MKKQTLQSKNLFAAKKIYNKLAMDKCLDFKTFRRVFFEARNDLGFTGCRKWDLTSYGCHKNWETTENFLIEKGLMTRDLINGFIHYSATQKCVRTKNFESAIK